MLHQIGVGALGPVFRTYEPDRDRLVAVKVFRLDITPEQARSLADELSRAAEAGLFHPSIVEPIAAGVEGSVAYNAEEYVAAESLDVAMRHYAQARPENVLPFITQLAGAIDFARAAGVGHGALHPRDIFMTPDEARATGFGVVEALERVGLRAPIRRPYSPPERIAGESWSTEADVFSLGAITYELLTGRRPAGLGAEIGDIPGTESLHAVLARAMAADPSRRFPTALSFASALEAAARSGSQPSATAAVLPPDDQFRATAISAAPAASLAQVPGGDIGADIAAERDEDEAHYRMAEEDLALAAGNAESVEHEAPPAMDEDSEVEAEADRYVGDDFLLDAAGAASSPEMSGHDEFGTESGPVDQRALEDDELMVDEPPTPLFQPEDLLREPGRSATAPADVTPSALGGRPEPAEPARQSFAPSFGHSSSSFEQLPPPESPSRLPLALTLLLGLLLGFVGGYALWGRSASPIGREFTEGTVTGPAAGTPREVPARPETSGVSAPPPSAGSDAAPSTAPRAEAASAPATKERDATSDARSATPPARPAARVTSGTLSVRSTPDGAGVTINGRWRGRTPLTLDKLPFARYDVRVVQPGYTPAREAVTLSADEPARSITVRLQQGLRPAPVARERTPEAKPSVPSPAAAPERYTGAIYVDSRPRGARVFIDGKPVGATPISIPEIPIGSHVVRLELPDHRIWSTTARVAAGQQARVTGSLERIQ